MLSDNFPSNIIVETSEASVPHTREKLEELANNIRLDVVRMSANSKRTGAHIGGSFSVAEILAALYGKVLHLYPDNPTNEFRDRVILSKSHAAIALYSALSYAGFISREQIENALLPDSELFKHPHKSLERGIECSGGSLGMGLSFAVGMAKGLRLKNNDVSRIFVILGDGECNEGSVWEAAASIVNYNYNNIITIVDANGFQLDGAGDDVMYMGRAEKRWESMGFDVVCVDGHDVSALVTELMPHRSKPTVVFCHTVKGKGVSFTENRVEWHMGHMSTEQTEQALKELSLH